MDLTDLEVASGMVSGGTPVALPPTDLDGRAAVEAVLLGLLAERPVTVAFSGGRDSSAVLALATHVARREGLPDPVPLTLRFPGVADAEESTWQDHVVAHLGLIDWERIALTDELDVLGPLATGNVLRHGVEWPVNVHFHDPLLARSAGAVLLTGVDGDGLLNGGRWRNVTGRGLHHARTTLAGVAPRRLHARRSLRAGSIPAWLTPAAQREVALADAALKREPRRWDRRLAWYRGRRHLDVCLRAFDRHAADHGAAIAHPLAEPLFLAGLARSGGRDGWPDRTAALAALVSDLLPDALVRRPTKARFTAAVVGPSVARFAGTWSGDGVPLASAAALRAQWASPRPDLRSLTALHAAWLADARAGTAAEPA